MTLFEHTPHPHIAARKEAGAPKASDHVFSFNDKVALKSTAVLGNMWFAYFCVILALLSLPAVLQATGWIGNFFPPSLVKASLIALVAWLAQTFIQLVALPILQKGQNLQTVSADARAEATYKDAEAVLHEALEIQRHLEAQDAILTRLASAGKKKA